MKKIALSVLLAALGTVLLAGCGSGVTGGEHPETPNANGTSSRGQTQEVNVRLEDGRTVKCVMWAYFNAGGMSCDWNNAKKSGN